MRICSPNDNVDHATLACFFQRFDGVIKWFGATIITSQIIACGDDPRSAPEEWELAEVARPGSAEAPIVTPHPDLDVIVGANPRDPGAATWCSYPRCAPYPLEPWTPPSASTCTERHFVYLENGSRDFRDRVTHTFDDMGRLIEETSDRSVTRYEYDQRGALTATLTTARGAETTRAYSRSAAGLLLQITEHSDDGGRLLFTFDYDARGRIIEQLDYSEDPLAPTRTAYGYADQYTRTTSVGARGQERPASEERWHPDGRPDYSRQLSTSAPWRDGLYRFVYDDARPELLIGHRAESPNHDPIELERYHYDDSRGLISYHMALATGPYEGLDIEDRIEITRRADGSPETMTYFGSRDAEPEYKITFEGQACERTVLRWKRDARRAMLRSCGELPCLP